MEPFKALTLLAAAAIVSLVAAGAGGFYAGYSAGRGNLEEIKAHISGAQAVIPSGNGNAVSLKPVIDDIRALSKQVEALTVAKANTASDNDSGTKLVLDEIKGLSSQIDSFRTESLKPLASPPPVAAMDRPAPLPPAPDYTEALQNIRDQVHALNAKFEKQEPKAPKTLVDEIRALGASIQAQEPNARRAVADEVRAAIATLQNAEPKAPKALVDEIRSLTSSIQAQEPNARRAVAEEVRSAIATLQAAEPKAPKALVEEIRSLHTAVQAQEPTVRRAVGEEVRSAVANLQTTEPKLPKALMEEIRAISAGVKAQDSRQQTPQASVVDQIKVLQASIEQLKMKLAEERGKSDSAATADMAQLRQLVASASDQFGKCQTQLASLGAGGASASVQAAAAPAPTTVTVTQEKRPEPSTVVFYDNVMLKKDQEKQYDEIGVKLSLQSVGSRMVRVAVNRQGFGLSFGERKVFRSQDVECEINLMETNLNDAQARVSISCKR